MFKNRRKNRRANLRQQAWFESLEAREFLTVASGDVIVPRDTDTGVVLDRINRSNGVVTTLNGPGTAGGTLIIDKLKVGPDGSLYAYQSRGDHSALIRIDSSTGDLLGTVIEDAGSSFFPPDFVVMPDGDVIIPDDNVAGAALTRFDAQTDQIITFSGPGASSGLLEVDHLKLGPDGSLYGYLTTNDNSSLVRMDATTGEIQSTVFTITDYFASDFAVLSNSDVIVPRYTGDSIVFDKFNHLTSQFTQVAGPDVWDAHLNLGPDGSLFIYQDFGAATSIVRIDPNNGNVLETVLAEATDFTVDFAILPSVPSVSISSDATFTEGNSGTSLATFTLTLNRASDQPITVTVNTANGTAEAGSDYVALSNQVITFTAGQTSKTVSVTLNGDLAFEAAETFFVNLSSPTNAILGDSQAIGTLSNDDAVGPSISVGDATTTEGNTGTHTVSFTLTLDAASGQAISVTVNTADGTASAGSDFVGLTNQVVTFNPGETTKSVLVTVLGDTSVETNETFTLNLSTPVNATIADAQGVATITNDDAVGPTIDISDAVVTEGNFGTANAVFTLTLLAPSGSTTTVLASTAVGTATAGDDFASFADQLITFYPGETTKTVSVSIVGDTTIEPDETFFVNLSSPTNAVIGDGQGQGTITNDDSLATTISIGDATVVEGNAGTVNAIFTITLSAASAQSTSVTVNTASGSATSGEDFSEVTGQVITFAPGETVKTVTVSVNGDVTFEPSETFTVTLSNAVNTTIEDGQATGTINNDDPVPPAPDLVVTADGSKLPAATISGNGKKISLPLTIRNQGTRPVAKGATIQIKIYTHLVTAGSDHSGDTLVGTYDKQSVSALAVGKTKKLTESILLPKSVATGAYQFYVMIDTGPLASIVGTGVAEMNETNNDALTAVVKPINVTQGVVDLRAAFGTVKFPKTILHESKTNIPIIITNGGNIAFGTNIKTSVVIKIHDVDDGNDAENDVQVIVLQIDISKLGAGKSKTLTAKSISFAVNALDEVQYRLAGVVDVNNDVPGESNEDNNVITNGATFTVTPPL